MSAAPSAEEEPAEIWVIDACSVIWVKESVPHATQPRVYKRLSHFVAQQSLVYPAQVHDEPARYKSAKKEPDRPLQWLIDNYAAATRFNVELSVVREVLTVAPRLIDAEKAKAVDEADPYVAALALQLQRAGRVVTVITEDRKDTLRKVSLTTACGLVRIVALPMAAFLEQQGIYSAV